MSDNLPRWITNEIGCARHAFRASGEDVELPNGTGSNVRIVGLWGSPSEAKTEAVEDHAQDLRHNRATHASRLWAEVLGVLTEADEATLRNRLLDLAMLSMVWLEQIDRRKEKTV